MTLELRTQRGSGSADKDAADATHESFITALQEATNAEQSLGIFVHVNLFYAGAARWRLPLLTAPPEIDEAGLGLGRVTLGGITLRFDESPVGMVSAELATNPLNESREVTLSFVLPIRPDDLANMYSLVLGKAESLGSLFVAVEASREKVIQA